MNHLEIYKQSLENTLQARDFLIKKFIAIRQYSSRICENLENEDLVVQPSQEVSPLKWHLGHTTWFFEELILVRFSKEFSRFNDKYRVLFNSYYKSAGGHWSQSDRGHLSRPTVKEVFFYREFIDQKIIEFLRSSIPNPEIDFLLEVGLNHEQQHQELLFMDIKYILGSNPLFPAYINKPKLPAQAGLRSWFEFKEGIYCVGHEGFSFAYDNEGPRHKTYIHPFSIREDTVSNGEYLEFVKDKAYSNPQFWLSEGWDWVNDNGISNPLYWQKKKGEWFEFTLHGLKPLDLNAPVTHISYFEANAFANWTNYRLPTEFEFEVFLNQFKTAQQDSFEIFHPNNANNPIGQVWCWTMSHYSPYPGFKTFKGVIGEYNGKFMCNQFVLRGGCVITPLGHYRHSYRNFYQPHQRWMFSGIRLAKDI